MYDPRFSHYPGDDRMRSFTAMNKYERDKKVFPPSGKKNRTSESSQRLHSKKRKGSTIDHDNNRSSDGSDIDNDTVENDSEME